MQRLSGILNEINDMIFIVDLNGQILECNTAVSKILSFENKDLIGKSIYNLYSAENRQEATEKFHKATSHHVEGFILPMLTKEDKTIAIEIHLHKSNWNGQPAIIAITHNLSELSLSEEKFRQIFNNSYALIAITLLNEGTVKEINDNFLRILGITKEEAIGKSSTDIGIFDSQIQRNSIIKKLIHGQKLTHKYIPICNKYGQLHHCVVNFEILTIQNNDYLLINAIDITKEKQNEYVLIEEIQHQELISKITQKLLNVYHFKDKINSVLKLLGEHTEVSCIYIFEENESTTGMTNTYRWCKNDTQQCIKLNTVIPYEEMPSIKPLLEQNKKIIAHKTEKLPLDIQNFIQPRDVGSFCAFPIFLRNKYFGCIIFENNAQFFGKINNDIKLIETVCSILSNAYERQITYQELKESEMRFDLAINNSQIGLWDWNMQTNNIFFNHVWHEMLGYTKNELQYNVNYTDSLVHPDDVSGVYAALYEHIEGKKDHFEHTYRLRTKSGKWKWVYNKGKVVEFDKNNQPLRYISTQIDIDEQKNNEENLKALNSTKDKLFSIIAHDLRGPIGTIMQISEMLSNRAIMDEKSFLQFISSQLELSRATYMLLENLLNWAKFNSDQVTYRPTNIDLKTTINESIATIKYLANLKNITIDTNLKTQIDAFADADMIKIIMRNLISNAIKFTSPGGNVTIKTEKKNNTITIFVIDNGIGMNDETINKILSKNEFYTTFGTANEKGSGLGLKLCQSLIALNHGNLMIDSEPNKGSSFYFDIPIAKSPI